MTEQWQELKETIIEMRDNDGTGTQQEACKFLTNLMDILEKQMQEPCEDMGEVSDGYHTFNQLYYQRAVLFATIVNLNKDKAWKSLKHFDGKYCFDSNGEWFIVGVDTPKGNYAYHYSKEYWNMFDCQELEYGKEWDGHTEEDIIRLLSLQQEPCEDAVSREAVLEITAETGALETQARVKALPPVTPKQKTGKWTGHREHCENLGVMPSGLGAYEWCSNCDCGIDVREWHRNHYNYCPNCGAKMEGESK